MEFIRSILCSDDIVKIMFQHIYPLFSFWFWYSSCFDVKCWFHTFLNRCSHISIGVLILLDHQDFHGNPFQPVCLLFKLFHTDAVEKSDVLSVSFIPSCLCFPHPPTLFLYGARILKWSIHFYSCDVSSFFSFNVLIRWFIVKMLKSFKFIILNSNILVSHVFQCENLLSRALLFYSTLSMFISGVLKIS